MDVTFGGESDGPLTGKVSPVVLTVRSPGQCHRNTGEHRGCSRNNWVCKVQILPPARLPFVSPLPSLRPCSTMSASENADHRVVESACTVYS